MAQPNKTIHHAGHQQHKMLDCLRRPGCAELEINRSRYDVQRSVAIVDDD